MISSVSAKKKVATTEPAEPAPDFDKPRMADGARSEALAGVLHSIERCYGKGSIQRLGETPSMIVETFSSGSMTLDLALGGGYPRGRVIEIYGPESSGKTTLALHAVAEIQRSGGDRRHQKCTRRFCLFLWFIVAVLRIRKRRVCGCRACSRSR